jgi:hypothetical protein
VADHDDRREAYLPPLPLGRLRPDTLVAVALGRSVHIRTGPWVPMREDDSRLLRVLPADQTSDGRVDGSVPPLRLVPRRVVAAPAPALAATQPIPVEPTPLPGEPEPVPTDPEPVPTDPEPVPIDPEPVPIDPEPVPTEPEPVPTASEPAAAAAPRGADPAATSPPPAEPRRPVTTRNRRTARRLARGRDPLLGRLTDAIQRSAASPVADHREVDEPTPGRAVHVPPSFAEAAEAPIVPDDERWEDLFAPRSWNSG